MRTIFKRCMVLMLVLGLLLTVLPVVFAHTHKDAQTSTASQQKPATRSGESFSIGSSGTFVIAANVDGVYYAMLNSFSSKILGSELTVTNGMVSEEDAQDFALTFTYNNGVYNISNDTHYLTYSSSTNLGASTTAYDWNIAEGTNGSWRITSAATPARGVVFRAKTY